MLFFLLPVLSVSKGQSSISGPECVVSGIEYQYSVSSGGSASMQICVEGGTLIGSTRNCINGSAVSTIRIVWDDLQTGIITLSAADKISKNITITTELQAGVISDSLKRIILYDGIPSVISCSAASGGGCSASYSYQWQESLDNVDWKPIEGATGQNLAISKRLSEATFFRRKVTNTVSKTTAYSQVASVFIIPKGLSSYNF